MIELYEQNKVPPSQGNEASGSTVVGTADKGSSKASKEEQGAHANSSLTEGPSMSGTLKPTHSYPEILDNQSIVRPRSSQNRSSDHGSSVVNASHHVNMEEFHDTTSGSNRHDTKDHTEKGNVLKRFDEDKLKQLREKRRKSRGEPVRRVDIIDEYDPIVKELEEGVELAAAAENEKSKHLRNELDAENVEEGEVSAFENSDIGPQAIDRKRKAVSPIESANDGKKWRDYDEDRSKLGRHAYADREHKRHVQENHF